MGVFTAPAHTWAILEGLTAANMNAQLRDFINGFGACTAYTPAWTATGTAPVLNNGTLTGSYSQVGKLVFVYGKLLMGSSTTYGTGNYSFSLPVASSAGLSNQNIPLSSVWMRDSSPAADYDGFAFASASTFSVRNAAATFGGNDQVGQTAPITWASGDWLSWSFWYESS
jgi:hypothetical protein